MAAPCVGVPLPAGSPTPSGPMLMSQAAKSFGATGCPNFCPSAAKAAPQPNESTSRMMVLCIDMAHLTIGIRRPTRDCIEVAGQDRGYGRDSFGLTALSYERRPRRLNVAGLVRRTALQDRRLTTPVPRDAEPRERLAQHGRIEHSQCPALTAVGRVFDLVDRAIARIGEAGNLVEARTLQCQARRGARDEGFDLLREEELPCLSARQQLGVLLGF